MKIHIVAEGILEVPTARKIITFCGHMPGTVYKLRGSGNIKKTLSSYVTLIDSNSAVLILTDFMDSGHHCIKSAVEDYLVDCRNIPYPNFLLRFAVNELESWLLADYINFSKLIDVKQNKISPSPDLLPDPKDHIKILAHLSQKKSIKSDLISHSGRQGKLYIPIMEKFIRDKWDIKVAIQRSPSLNRCIKRLLDLKSL